MTNTRNNDVLTIEQRGAVATLTLNRPDVHNAFDERLIADLTEAFEGVSEDPDVRVVVLRGAGKSFSAGADLAWMGRMAGYSREENQADAATAQRMFAALYHCPKVTIARVHGPARGGGVGLVAACDIAIATDTADFAFTEVRLGIIPAIIAPYVTEKIGAGAARALFVTGRKFGAGEAFVRGLIHQVVVDSDLDAAVERTVADALSAGPEAVARVKLLLHRIAGKTPDGAAAETVAALAEVRVGEEGQEGIRAFIEKRKPEWKPE